MEPTREMLAREACEWWHRIGALVDEIDGVKALDAPVMRAAENLQGAVADRIDALVENDAERARLLDETAVA